jgi:uncharacterized beta-barrel protein YwiB (DUF1934 family)
MKGLWKMDVLLTIQSKSDGEALVQKVKGVLYLRDGKLFYQYKEPESEMGRISAILRVEKEGIRLLRQGDIKSEQQFLLNKKLPGYYDMPHGRLELDTFTRSLHIALENGIGRMEWSYDLYVSGELTSTHELNVEVAPL